MARAATFGKAMIVTFALIAFAFLTCLPQIAFANDSMEVVTYKDAGKAVVYDVTSTKPGKLHVTLVAVKDADGYDYQIARNKSFTSSLKEKTKSSTIVTFSGLAKGKTYYIRARGYQVYEGVKYCTKWSSVTKATVAIKSAKTIIVGTWKLVKSSDADENNAIKEMRKNYPKKKYTLTFNRKGAMVERDYSRKKIGTLKWAATTKRAGYFVVKGLKVGSIKVKGKKLIMDTTKMIWTLERVK